MSASAGNRGLIAGLRRSFGGGNGNPLQYSCLENFMERGTWWPTVHGIPKSQTQLSDLTLFLLHIPQIICIIVNVIFQTLETLPHITTSDCHCRCLAWYMSVCAQLCQTLCVPIYCLPPGFSLRGVSQARILEWGAISPLGSSLPRDRTCISCVSCIGRWILHHCATWEAPSVIYTTFHKPVTGSFSSLILLHPCPVP